MEASKTCHSPPKRPRLEAEMPSQARPDLQRVLDQPQKKPRLEVQTTVQDVLLKTSPPKEFDLFGDWDFPPPPIPRIYSLPAPAVQDDPLNPSPSKPRLEDYDPLNPEFDMFKYWSESVPISTHYSPNPVTSTAEEDELTLQFLLKFVLKPLPPPTAPGLPSNIPRCSPRLEVFSVMIEDVVSPDLPVELYGKILAESTEGDQRLFYHEKGDPKSMVPGRQLTLEGPISALCALSDVVITVDLMSGDNRVIKGSMGWSCTPSYRDFLTVIPGTSFDVPLFRKIDGANGLSATIVYAVFRQAAEAKLVVTLIQGRLPGLITAGNDKDAFADYRSVLFKNKSPNDIQVGSGGQVALSRRMVSVPKESYLVIRSHDSDSADKVTSTAKFPVQEKGTFEETLSGDYGIIKVTVTWAASPQAYHVETCTTAHCVCYSIPMWKSWASGAGGKKKSVFV